MYHDHQNKTEENRCDVTRLGMQMSIMQMLCDIENRMTEKDRFLRRVANL